MFSFAPQNTSHAITSSVEFMYAEYGKLIIYKVFAPRPLGAGARGRGRHVMVNDVVMKHMKG